MIEREPSPLPRKSKGEESAGGGDLEKSHQSTVHIGARRRFDALKHTEVLARLREKLSTICWDGLRRQRRNLSKEEIRGGTERVLEKARLDGILATEVMDETRDRRGPIYKCCLRSCLAEVRELGDFAMVTARTVLIEWITPVPAKDKEHDQANGEPQEGLA